MLVDTGMTSSSVTPKSAARLHLTPQFKAVDVTPAGQRMTAGTRSVKVKMGTSVAENVSFIWQDLNGLRDMGIDVDGALGQSFLSRFDYVLDYRNRQITLGPAASMSEGERIDFSRASGRMLVPAWNADGKALQLVLDSGASNLCLFDVGEDQPGLRNVSMLATNGSRGVRLFRLAKLIVGDQVLRKLDSVLSGSADEQRVEDGLLPASLFASVYVSNSESYIKLRK